MTVSAAGRRSRSAALGASPPANTSTVPVGWADSASEISEEDSTMAGTGYPPQPGGCGRLPRTQRGCGEVSFKRARQRCGQGDEGAGVDHRTGAPGTGIHRWSAAGRVWSGGRCNGYRRMARHACPQRRTRNTHASNTGQRSIVVGCTSGGRTVAGRRCARIHRPRRHRAVPASQRDVRAHHDGRSGSSGRNGRRCCPDGRSSGSQGSTSARTRFS